MHLVYHEPMPNVLCLVHHPRQLQILGVVKRGLRDSVEVEHKAVYSIDSEKARLFAEWAWSAEGRHALASVLLRNGSREMKLHRDTVLGQSSQRASEYNTSFDHLYLG